MPQLRSFFTTPSHVALLLALVCSPALFAQNAQTAGASPATGANAAPVTHYLPAPAFDLSSINKAADPCTDFYKFACGNFAANHPIPADQPDVDQFYLLYNVNTQDLNGILTKFSDPANQKTPNEQKIGDYYAACMNTALINQKGMAPVQPLFDQIDKVSKHGIAYLAGELQRYGVDVFFGFGEMQDFKDSTKQIAVADQGGLGLPERDYYTRTGDKDVKLREQYVDHVAKMLTFAGETPEQAATDAKNILAFETAARQGLPHRHRPARPAEDLPPHHARRLREGQPDRRSLRQLPRGHPLAPDHLAQRRQPQLLPRHGRGRL